ncbi:MAG: hypothetical protein JW822_02015 [Spirochaetales bacterium]|nr:hypothetical protein [Spirochaetales bacterium]
MQFFYDILTYIQNFYSDTTNIFLSILVLIALFAACAALSAFNSSKQTKKALRAQMMSDLLDSRYTEKNIVARKNLINYHETCRKHGFDYVKTFLDNRNKRTVEKEIDKSRQIVFAYFDKIYRLEQSGLLQVKDLNRLIDNNELHLFINKCWPLVSGVINAQPHPLKPKSSKYSEKQVYEFYYSLYHKRY